VQAGADLAGQIVQDAGASALEN
jgi:hypothetical protein